MAELFSVSILTIFPKLFENFLSESLVGKAIERGLASFKLVNIRDFSDAPHFRVDDTPYGGGAGMVMRAEPICRAVESITSEGFKGKVILLSASGKKFDQKMARELSQENELVFICGRYEGVDQRAIELCVDEEVCIGDFVLMGGEVAAMAVIEATLRLRNDVLGNSESLIQESFSEAQSGSILLESPQYTKPAELRGKQVPQELLSGNHEIIRRWRNENSLARTTQLRPDLLRKSRE